MSYIQLYPFKNEFSRLMYLVMIISKVYELRGESFLKNRLLQSTFEDIKNVIELENLQISTSIQIQVSII